MDLAGSTAVHMCGGLAALIGAKLLGPRIGKYTKNPDSTTRINAIPGHSLTLAALGVFILWFCWYGFNGAAATDTVSAAQILSITTIASAVASCATMFFTWIKDGKPLASTSQATLRVITCDRFLIAISGNDDLVFTLIAGSAGAAQGVR